MRYIEAKQQARMISGRQHASMAMLKLALASRMQYLQAMFWGWQSDDGRESMAVHVA
jgi:hypothetical protein